MGVPGFAAYVRPLGVPVTLERDTQLLVDGSSLAFHVVDKLGAEAFREECGDYDAVHRGVVEIVQGWLDAGLNVVVVADGRASDAKRATLQRRRRQRYARYQLLLQHLRHNSRAARSSSLPPPPLFTVQVMASLLALERQHADRLQVVRACGEADTVLGKLCRDARRAGRPAVVVGNDSDYLLMRGIRYVEMAALGPGRSAVESSRDHIAQLLGVREDAMTDLAIALGNDFVGDELDVSASASTARIEAALETLRAGGELAPPEVANVAAAEALAEVRMMYDNDFELRPTEVRSLLKTAGEDLEDDDEQPADLIVLSSKEETSSTAVDLRPLLNRLEQLELPSPEGLRLVVRIVRSVELKVAALCKQVHVARGLAAAEPEDMRDLAMDVFDIFMGTSGLYDASFANVGKNSLQRVPSKRELARWPSYLVAFAFQLAMRWAMRRQPRMLLETPPAGIYYRHAFFAPSFAWGNPSKLQEMPRLEAAAVLEEAGDTLDADPDQTLTDSKPAALEGAGDQQPQHTADAPDPVAFLGKVKQRLPAESAKAFDAALKAYSKDPLATKARMIGLLAGQRDLRESLDGVLGQVDLNAAQGAAPTETAATKEEEEKADPALDLVRDVKQRLPREGSQAFITALQSISQDPAAATTRMSELLAPHPDLSARFSEIVQSPKSTKAAAPAPAPPSPPMAAGRTSSRRRVGGPGSGRRRGSERARAAGRQRPGQSAMQPEPQQQSQQQSQPQQQPQQQQRLPVDDHRDHILQCIRTQRVTIVHGETGSGKSSRIPVMLLDEAGSGKVMVSQPRRIAARSLHQRIRSVLGPERADVVGLRLGGGLREETKATRLWYVTTGYLVRKLASDPDFFDDFSHLVLDEIHERSVDMDILCLLAKRLLDSNRRIRLVLMSATLQAELFQRYFSLPEPPIFVGAKRFPLTEFWLDSQETLDMLEVGSYSRLASDTQDLVRMMNFLRPSRGKLQITGALNTKTLRVCAGLVDKLAQSTESAILIFVSGMADIVQLTHEFEALNEVRFGPLAEEVKAQAAQAGAEATAANLIAAAAGREQALAHSQHKLLRCIAIHSSIPYDEQLAAWSDSGPREAKVIIATNAAESSITLPDVDLVVCLGQRKQVEFDARSQTTHLIDRFISQASAVQRAGRTARTRPGTVYRLYTRAVWDKLPAFDPPEIHSCPLDKVLLDLKSLVDGPVLNMLREVVDPPEAAQAEQAMLSLFHKGLVDGPEDSAARRTALGVFVSRLGLDLAVGVLIARAALLDLLPEGLAVAAAMASTQSPWRVATPLVHKDPDVYHGIVSDVLATKLALDGGAHSEHMATVRLLSIWQHCRRTSFRSRFCAVSGLAFARMGRLGIVHEHMQRSVAVALRLRDKDLALPPPQEVLRDAARVGRLRFLLFSLTPGNLLHVSANPGRPSAYSSDYAVRGNLCDAEARYFKIARWQLSVPQTQKLMPSGVEWHCAVRSKVHAAASLDFGAASVDQARDFILTKAANWLLPPDDVRLLDLVAQFAPWEAAAKARDAAEERRKADSQLGSAGATPTVGASAEPAQAVVVLVRVAFIKENPVGFDDYDDSDDDYYDDFDDEDDFEDYLDEVRQRRPATEQRHETFLLAANHPALASALADVLSGANQPNSVPGMSLFEPHNVPSVSPAKVLCWRVGDRTPPMLNLFLNDAIGPVLTMTLTITHAEVAKLSTTTLELVGNAVALTAADAETKLGWHQRAGKSQRRLRSFRWLTKPQLHHKSVELLLRHDAEGEDALKRHLHNDSPFAVKLLAAYASGNRPATMVFANGPQVGGRPTTVEQPLPRMLAGVYKPERIPVPAGARGQGGEGNTFIKNPGVKRVWVNGAPLERFVLPQPTRPLYAVASTVAMLVVNSNSDVASSEPNAASVEGITLLPAGAPWLSRALLCIGGRQIPFRVEGSVAATCQAVYEGLSQLLTEGDASRPVFLPNDDIIEGVDVLFGEMDKALAPLPSDYYELPGQAAGAKLAEATNMDNTPQSNTPQSSNTT